MKNILIKTTIISLTALTLGSGCSKNFLEQEVPGQLSEQNFYQSDADALQATTAVYDMMQAHYNSNWASLYFVKTMPSDESNAAGSGPSDQPGYQTLDDYTYDAENDKIRDSWRTLYFTIFRANQVINRVTPETDLRKRLVAEAKVLRAYNYLDLVSLWGDVPLVTGDVAPSAYTSTPRAKKEEVYAQIIADLKDAFNVLPEKSAYSAADKYRVSKGTAQALLGKTYLYQQQWQQAAQELEGVITSGQYTLESSVAKVFSKAGEFGVESIFEIAYTTNRDYDWGNFPWGGAPESNIHIQLMGPRSDYYVKAPSDSLIGGWGFNMAKQKLYQAFVAAGDEVRRKSTVMSEAELKSMGGDWTAPNAYDYEGYFQRKYGTFVTQTNGVGGAIPELNYGTNWRLIRYADVLLMAAEANFRAGNEAKARTYLNGVRQRSNLADVTATGDALFEAIVRERQLELAFEGFRFIDLVRWGRANQELSALGFQQGKHELMPIPSQDVRTAGLQQNPNY